MSPSKNLSSLLKNLDDKNVNLKKQGESLDNDLDVTMMLEGKVTNGSQQQHQEK